MTDDPTSHFTKQLLDFWQDQTLRNVTQPDNLRAMLDMMERTAHGMTHGSPASSAPDPAAAAREHAVAMAALEHRLRDCEARLAALERDAKPARPAPKRRAKKN